MEAERRNDATTVPRLESNSELCGNVECAHSASMALRQPESCLDLSIFELCFKGTFFINMT